MRKKIIIDMSSIIEDIGRFKSTRIGLLKPRGMVECAVNAIREEAEEFMETPFVYLQSTNAIIDVLVREMGTPITKTNVHNSAYEQIIWAVATLVKSIYDFIRGSLERENVPIYQLNTLSVAGWHGNSIIIGIET